MPMGDPRRERPALAFARRLVGAVPLYRWLREAISPHRRAVRIARETQGDLLLQWSSATSADRYPPYFEALQRELAGVESPRILSFGCASGEEVFTLRRYFPAAELIGIDINSHAIALAQRQLAALPGQAAITFRCAGSLSSEPAGQYDAILAMAVLRHGELTRLRPDSCAEYLSFAKAERAVADLARCLKPGGLLMASNCNFRVIDMAPARQFDVAFSDPLGLTQPEPLYGPDNRKLESPANCEVIFRKKAGPA